VSPRRERHLPSSFRRPEPATWNLQPGTSHPPPTPNTQHPAPFFPVPPPPLQCERPPKKQAPISKILKKILRPTGNPGLTTKSAIRVRQCYGGQLGHRRPAILRAPNTKHPTPCPPFFPLVPPPCTTTIPAEKGGPQFENPEKKRLPHGKFRTYVEGVLADRKSAIANRQFFSPSTLTMRAPPENMRPDLENVEKSLWPHGEFWTYVEIGNGRGPFRTPTDAGLVGAGPCACPRLTTTQHMRGRARGPAPTRVSEKGHADRQSAFADAAARESAIANLQLATLQRSAEGGPPLGVRPSGRIFRLECGLQAVSSA